jgi:hypothetical protein
MSACADQIVHALRVPQSSQRSTFTNDVASPTDLCSPEEVLAVQLSVFLCLPLYSDLGLPGPSDLSAY